MLHRVAQAALALVVIVSVTLAGIAWRLAQGPIELAGLASLLQEAVGADAIVRVRFGGAAIAWEGFRRGFDQPIDIRLSDISVDDHTGHRIAAVPYAAFTLSPAWLLVGRIVPRAIEVSGARLHVLIGADGRWAFDIGAQAAEGGADLPRLVRELVKRPATDRSAGGQSVWSQLRRVRIADAALEVTDRRHDLAWSVPHLSVDLHRPSGGGISGTGSATLALGDLSIGFDLQARLAADAQRTEVSAQLAPVIPAAVARVLPPAAALGMLDAPVSLAVTATFGPDVTVTNLEAHVRVGAGTLHLGEGTAPLLDAAIDVQGTPQRVTADIIRLVTAPGSDGPRSTITGRVVAIRTPDHIEAAITADLDQVAFADLPILWPAGIGGPGTRPWITENITAGTVHDFHVETTLMIPTDLSDVTVTRLAGGGSGSDLTVHWLRPVPPIVHGEVRLSFLDPDTIEVVAAGGQEILGHDTIEIRGGRVVFTGIAGKDQFADITADLSGPIAGALALLKEPRVRLLDRSPIKPQGADGQFAGSLTLTHLPLRRNVTMDDLQIRTALKLTNAHLAGVAAGRDLDHGTLDVSADTDGMHLSGQASIAGVLAQLQAEMDFRAGPPSQVLENVSLIGTVDAAQLAEIGGDISDYATGTARVTAHLAMRRDHAGQVSVQADLADTALTLDIVGFHKPRGQPARLEARLSLARDRIAALDSVQLDGVDLHVAGAVAFAEGQPSVLRLDRVAIGTVTNLHGQIGVPRRAGEEWRADLAGTGIDLSGILKHRSRASRQERAGLPYAVDARFDRVVLGVGRALAAVSVHAENDGRIMRRLSLSGQTEHARSFRLEIAPLPGTRRRLSGDVDDAGALLRALDIVNNVQGGHLVIAGVYDDAVPDHPLNGRVEAADFRVRNAPLLAKLLQAMTLYGLVDAIQGPGLGFSRLVAPFRLTNNMLDLTDVRAFSSSLGMTAKGRIDLDRSTFDLTGTIVPAYFFNSLLGDLPLVGKLFSPERGGGVFAATYVLRGPFGDPHISVNPLAALTPGFLRGLFGLF